MNDHDLWISTWKRIGAQIGVNAQTAKKYYKIYGLPVYRLPNNVPVAFSDQLRQWLIKFDELKKMKKNENS